MTFVATEKKQTTMFGDGRCYNPKCGKALKRYNAPSQYWKIAPDIQCYGFGGNMFFCSKMCAVEFAVERASTLL